MQPVDTVAARNHPSGQSITQLLVGRLLNISCQLEIPSDIYLHHESRTALLLRLGGNLCSGCTCLGFQVNIGSGHLRTRSRHAVLPSLLRGC
jgi:hypothetical protein